MTKKQISVRLARDDKDRLDYLKERTGDTQAGVIGKALLLYFIEFRYRFGGLDDAEISENELLENWDLEEHA
jgi:hypothetical protein